VCILLVPLWYIIDWWPLACWDCGFESRRGHGCLSLVIVVCCQVEVSATGWSLVNRSPTDCSVSKCDREASITRRPWPTRVCEAVKKNIFRAHAITSSFSVVHLTMLLTYCTDSTGRILDEWVIGRKQLWPCRGTILSLPLIEGAEKSHERYRQMYPMSRPRFASSTPLTQL
jgi:hypothetical protein